MLHYSNDSAAIFGCKYMVSFAFLDMKFTQSIIFPQKMLMSFGFLSLVLVFFEGKNFTNF